MNPPDRRRETFPPELPIDPSGQVQWPEDLLEEAPDLPPKHEGSLITTPPDEFARPDEQLGDGKTTLVSTRAFESIHVPLMEVVRLLEAVEQRMESLKDSFNDSVPKSLLRLRPWPRRKGESPYALYWIFFQRIRRTFDPYTFRETTEQKPRRFRRLKIRTRADLSAAAHLARLDAHRREVFEFHDRAQALNEAHRVLARSLDSIRKMVSGRIGECFDCPPLKDSRFAHAPFRVYRWIERLWNVGWTIRQTTDFLRQLAASRRELYPRCRYRLHFCEDSEHPYGRLLWRDELSRVSYSSLTHRERRRLRIPRSESVADFEWARRMYARRLHGLARLVKRIRLKLSYALRTGRAAFDRGRPPSAFPYLEAR